MSQQMLIGGKVYETSTALAAAFGYTPDYVSKLAREKKVTAEQINRQWYIERSSLAAFSRNADQRQMARREALSEERKRERAAHTGTQQQQSPLSSPARTLSRAAGIFVVAGVVVSFGFIALDSRVGTTELEQGARVVAHDVLSLGQNVGAPDSMQAGLLNWFKRYWQSEPVVPEASVTPVTVPVEPPAPAPVPTELAIDNAGLVLMDANTTDSTVNAVRALFSDPVDVAFDGDDSGIITPVFKEQSDESYRFLLVPVRHADSAEPNESSGALRN